MKIKKFLLMLMVPCSLAFAEIEEIKITWTAVECTPECAARLASEFGKIYGVANVDMNQPAGQANLKWKPNVPFSFYPINTALRMVGPRFHNLRAKVKGRIKQDMNIVKLISDGDGTEFFLLNPVAPIPGQYTELHSRFNRELSPELKQQLIASEGKQIAIIEGPIFEPFRSPPLQLVVENVSFEDIK